MNHHFPHISDRKCRVAGGSNPHPGTRAGLAAARQVSAGLVVGGQYRGGSQVRFFWPKNYAENPNGDYIKIYILHGSIGIYLVSFLWFSNGVPELLELLVGTITQHTQLLLGFACL